MLSGGPDAKTTPYGDSCMCSPFPVQSARLTNETIVITASFTTGEPKYKELETSIFTGAGHFVIEDGKTIVEYKVSKVVHR